MLTYTEIHTGFLTSHSAQNHPMDVVMVGQDYVTMVS